MRYIVLLIVFNYIPVLYNLNRAFEKLDVTILVAKNKTKESNNKFIKLYNKSKTKHRIAPNKTIDASIDSKTNLFFLY